LLVAAPVWAVPASDALLPKTTKGYISVAKAKEFQERWDRSQLGELFNDETMQPFVEDFRNQLRDDFGSIQRKLGFVPEDLYDVPTGELSLAIIERKDPEAVMSVMMDVTGNAKKADEFLAAVEKRFILKGGKKTTRKVGDTTLSVFTAPGEKPGKTQQTTYFIKDNFLVGIDDAPEADAILKRWAGNATDSLKAVPAYTFTMERCRKQAGSMEPEIRFFVEPFGLIFAARTLSTRPLASGPDMTKMLYENGFDAVQGIGGYLNQLVDGGIEYLARASVYAPPVKGKENDPLRWNLSMRMMQLPNAAPTEPQSFVPRMLASYSTANLSLADMFDNIGPLFDAVQEHEDAWKTTLEGWKTDKYGPQVDVRKEFIANMGSRISLLTAYDTPATETSERSLVAIEAANEKELAKTLDKWMSHERDVKRREVGPYVIWERPKKAATAAVEEPIEIPGFGSSKKAGGKNKPPKRKRERVLPDQAVTVATGHLLMASDTQYLIDLLEGFAQRERLASSSDYQQVLAALNKLMPEERSGWAFGRSDEELRQNYELIRQGRMPAAKSIIGKMLNNMFTTDEDVRAGTPRKQKIDGKTLPEFETVRRYFGPHGRIVHSEPDGWFITGAIMNKEAP
jgi:hypothetical protein